MSTDNNKENKDGIVKANILALQKNSSGLVQRALQDIDVIIANPNLLIKSTTKINPIDGAEMVLVPGGTFTMGSIDGVGLDDEYPAHQVTLSDYWIYKYDVTVAQYLAFCAATSRKLPKFPKGYSWKGKYNWDDSELQKHPIVNVSWDDCKSYADWAGVNLPTEAQWEYAARGPQGNNYPWGGTANASDPYNGRDDTKYVNYYNSYNIGKSTWPVGSFPVGASWCGAQDMAGNVWQWCADWYGDYSSEPVTNPTGPATGDYHVLRGGSWGNNGYGHRQSRCVSRRRQVLNYSIGFRCAVSIPENEVLITTNLQISESNDNIVQIKQTEQTIVKSFQITKINPKDGAEMVWVPSGTFTMGNPDGVGWSGREHPSHQVTLSGYWMYKYPVTVAQYGVFCVATEHDLPEFPEGLSWEDKSGWDDPDLQRHPIVNLTWDDCKAYADWACVNLSTEAQWEYAARGPERRNYPWGGMATSDDEYNGWDESKCANSENSRSQNISTWPVGSFPEGASWCGAQDLAGNVCEWCADWYGDYSSTPVTNPTGPLLGDYRVLRGGSWGGNYGDYYYYYDYRGACRCIYYPNSSGYGIGFRCASPGP